MTEDLHGSIGMDRSGADQNNPMEDNNYLYIKSLDPKYYESFRLLNKYQKAAVVNDDAALLLNAGVGSGKTTVLVHKVLYLYLIKKVPLDEMVVLTFTNKAADEIRERVTAYDGGISGKDMAFFGTFHSVARSLLSGVLPVEELGYTREFSIMDENRSREVMDSIINTHGLDIKYRKRIEKRLEEYKKGRFIYGNMKHDDEISTLAALMEQQKKDRNLMDFDDLVDCCARLLKRGIFKPSWVIIDEFQDTDSSQLDMVDGLYQKGSHIFAVGDPNQLIYSWRGSREDIFTVFVQKYNAVESTLPINYRSTATILEAAGAFLTKQTRLEGIRDMGTPIVVRRHYNSFNEALYLVDTIKRLHTQGVSYNEIAVFYRKQKQSRVFEDVFKNHDVPYEVSAKKNIRDIPVLYWLQRLLNSAINSRDMESFIYAVCDKSYGIGITQRKAADLIRRSSECAGGMDSLVCKISGFRSWCGRVEGIEGIGRRIYGYFDIERCLSPTSITFDEDRELVMMYLNNIEAYIRQNNYGVWEGIRCAQEYHILNGNQVMGSLTDKPAECVKLMTLHASKGLEFKYVFISGANMGVIPIGSRFDDDEEKRLFFVGITRAKDYLEISYHSNPEDYNALPGPSPYIRMIPDELVEGDEIKSRSHKLSELRREIRNNMEKRVQADEKLKPIAVHPKYGRGYVVSETDDTVTVEFEGYGEKSFSRMFCPLEFPKG